MVDSVHYWNKDNFQGLKDLSIALDAHLPLQRLAEYCRYREQGLRRQAFAALDQFLAEAAGWKQSDARVTCLTILDLHRRTPAVHQFLTHPLLSRLLIPTLEAWIGDEPEAAVPLRWLGILTGREDFVCRALAVAPEDTIARRYLVGHFSSYDGCVDKSWVIQLGDSGCGRSMWCV